MYCVACTYRARKPENILGNLEIVPFACFVNYLNSTLFVDHKFHLTISVDPYKNHVKRKIQT